VSWIVPKTFVDGEVMAAQYHNDWVDDLDYLKGAQTAQEEVELEAALSLAGDVTSRAENEFLELRARQFLLSSTFSFAGYHASALTSGDAVDLRFSLREPGGTIEDLAVIRFRKSASISGRGGIDFIAASGGAFGTPQMRLHPQSRISINSGSSPVEVIEVTGDVNATGYENLQIWSEEGGDAYHNGDAIITEQYISTAVSGAPLKAEENSPTCENLNAEFLQGEGWPSATYSGTGSDTIDTAATDYTVASFTAGAAGLYFLVGECTVTVDTNDDGAVFSLEAPGAPAPDSCSGRVVTEQIALASCGFYEASNAETITLICSKDSGTGTSAAAGSLVGYRIGPA